MAIIIFKVSFYLDKISIIKNLIYTRQESSVIHLASPTVPPTVNIKSNCRLDSLL